MTERRRRTHVGPAVASTVPASPAMMDPDIEAPSPGGPARPSFSHIAIVLVGGIVGTMARDAVVVSFPAPPASLPWATIIINISGALLLGILGGLLFEHRPELVGWRLFLGTGLLGGWTTYSAIVADALMLGHHHALGWAVGLLFIALVVPVLAAALGLIVGRRLIPSAAA